MLSLAVRNFSARKLRAALDRARRLLRRRDGRRNADAHRLGQPLLRHAVHRGQRGHRRHRASAGRGRGRVRLQLRPPARRVPGRRGARDRGGRDRGGHDRRRHDHDRRRGRRADRPARWRTAAHRGQRAPRRGAVPAVHDHRGRDAGHRRRGGDRQHHRRERGLRGRRHDQGHRGRRARRTTRSRGSASSGPAPRSAAPAWSSSRSRRPSA